MRNGVAEEPQCDRIRESRTQDDFFPMGGAEIVRGTAQASHLPKAHRLAKREAKRRRVCHTERAAVKRAASERVLQWLHQGQSVAAVDFDRDSDRSVVANRAWLPGELALDPEVASTGLHGLACGRAAQVAATRHDRARRWRGVGGSPATVAEVDPPWPSAELGCPETVTNTSTEPTSRFHQSCVRTSHRKEFSERKDAWQQGGPSTRCLAGDTCRLPPRQQAAPARLQTERGSKLYNAQVRKTPSWPSSWANFSRF